MNSNSEDEGDVFQQAAQWLARRDRGMSAEEQDRYLEWLSQSSSNRDGLARLERTWLELNKLKEWRPSDSRQPNPDLLALPRARPTRPIWFAAVLSAAAAVVVAFSLFLQPKATHEPQQQARIHPGAERMVLDDGSVVELNNGAEIKVEYSPGERRVVLVRGDAVFTVAKNPDRPFVVAADCLAVRALGTTFAVSLKDEAIAVLVTEGKVRVDEAVSAQSTDSAPVRELSHVVAGQQALISLPGLKKDKVENVELVLQLRDVTPAEIEQTLSWQNLRLEFVDMPLRAVVAEFNRYNARKLVVADDATGAIVIGGSFRADHVESFVRLLGSGFGVASSTRGNEILLTKEP